MAPTDEAFTTLLRQLGGGRRLPKERLFELPELPQILLYHILPGRFLTGARAQVRREHVLPRSLWPVSVCAPARLPAPLSCLIGAGDLYNNTPIYTAQGVDVTPFTDPCMMDDDSRAGKIMLHDGCVDKPTPDNFTCEVRAPHADRVLLRAAPAWPGTGCHGPCCLPPRTCLQEQVLYAKCSFPFMTSALAAQWQGGFCQRT